jgi:hypothetical protein
MKTKYHVGRKLSCGCIALLLNLECLGEFEDHLRQRHYRLLHVWQRPRAGFPRAKDVGCELFHETVLLLRFGHCPESFPCWWPWRWLSWSSRCNIFKYGFSLTGCLLAAAGGMHLLIAFSAMRRWRAAALRWKFSRLVVMTMFLRGGWLASGTGCWLLDSPVAVSGVGLCVDISISTR